MNDSIKKQIVVKIPGVVLSALCWPLCASAQASYTLADLGVVGPAGAPNYIANNGVSGARSRVPMATTMR